MRSNAFEPLKNLLHDLERLRERKLRKLTQLQQQRILAGDGAQQRHGRLTVDAAAFGKERPEVAVLFAVVVVQMRGADASLQNRVSRGNAFLHVGVAYIQTEVHLEVRLLQETDQALRARKLVGNVLQQHLHAALAREQVDLFQRRERGLNLAVVVLFVGNSEVLDQITKRNDFRNVQRALDLFDHKEPLRFHRLGNGDEGVRAGPSPHVVAIHRRVQRMQLQLRGAQPVAQFN